MSRARQPRGRRDGSSWTRRDTVTEGNPYVVTLEELPSAWRTIAEERRSFGEEPPTAKKAARPLTKDEAESRKR
jgi:hypothetical protein